MSNAAGRETAVTVPSEYDGFHYMRGGVPVPVVLGWVAVTTLAAVGLIAPPLVSGKDGSPLWVLLTLAAVAAGLAAVAWLRSRVERWEESLRQDPSLYYRTVTDTVETSDGRAIEVTFREYADGTRGEPSVRVAG